MIYADLHIHIGQSLDGKAVKITASSALTLPECINVSRTVKGLGLIGIIDSHSIGVRRDYRYLLSSGQLRLLEGGGYQAGSLVIIPGMEVELKVGQGHAHFLSYFPSIEHMESFLKKAQPYARNWQLSSQKIYMEVEEYIYSVEEAEGFWLPAHAFTPHKGIYGSCCIRMKDVLPKLPGCLEMGLSADRMMVLGISELEDVILFSNSDAHSLANIGREYNELILDDNSYSGLFNLVMKKKGDISRNFGIPPVMGKYYRTFCTQCSSVVEEQPPQTTCPYCYSQDVILGVRDRLCLISGRSIQDEMKDSRYIYRVPLRWLPGVGDIIYRKLLNSFGTEIAVYHQVRTSDFIPVVGEKVAEVLEKAQRGELHFSPGGGGFFGKVKT